MIKKARKVIRYLSLLFTKLESKSGRIRGIVEFNSQSYISLRSKITDPEDTIIGNHTQIYPNTILISGDNGIKIGDHCTIHEFGYIAGNIKIGNDVRIAQKVSMHSFNHGINKNKKVRLQEGDTGEIVIGNDVWIGCDVTILKDVHIEEGAVIGAGSVLTENVASYEIVAGNPAQKIGERS